MKNRQSFPGEVLRERRSEMGLSLDDVFAAIHVPMESLKALESGDLTSLPSESYAAGFLKTYCRLLDLPAERYVDSLRMCLAAPQNRFFPSKTAQQRSPKNGWLSEVITWAAVLAVLGLGWLTYMVVVRPEAEITDRQVEAGPADLELSPPPISDSHLP